VSSLAANPRASHTVTFSLPALIDAIRGVVVAQCHSDDRHHFAITNAIFAIVEFQFHQKFVLFEIGFVEPSKKPKKPKPTPKKKKKKKTRQSRKVSHFEKTQFFSSFL
jgi:hypothetical protein